MIDIQYLAIPMTKKLLNEENNRTTWFVIDELKDEKNIEDDIKKKVITLYEQYKDVMI